jgi:hypothetical protein
LGFHKWRYPPIAGGFIRENLINMDDLGVPLFQEPSIWLARGILPFFGLNSSIQVALRSGMTKSEVSIQVVKYSHKPRYMTLVTA